ncbi:MAG: hypothetical protein EON54_27020 [Alcaligenaceae bacterium]|nr:MAG: hypothetical protein EON54_27020 [Alcaligenaceae bacterium]
MKHVTAATLEVKHADIGIRGKVSVGIPHSTAAVLALPLLRLIREKLPLVEIALHEGLSGLLGEQLDSGRLDFSILFDPEPQTGLETTPLFSERLHFVSADPAICKAYAGAREISLRDVMARPLILPPQPNGIRMLLERESLRLNMRPRVVADITGVATMLAAVHAGLADSVMMAVNAGGAAADNIRLVLPVAEPAITRRACLVEPAHFRLTTAATAVKAITLQVIEELVSDGKWPGAAIEQVPHRETDFDPSPPQTPAGLG